MPISESGRRLKDRIKKAIADEEITRAEMDDILHLATEDGHIDAMEQALLNQLQQMIEDKMVKFVH